jgi:hypothetical protein
LRRRGLRGEKRFQGTVLRWKVAESGYCFVLLGFCYPVTVIVRVRWMDAHFFGLVSSPDVGMAEIAHYDICTTPFPFCLEMLN